MVLELIAAIIDEPPNIISLIYKRDYRAPWAQFLHYWENVIFSVFIAVLVVIIFKIGIKRKALIPQGLQNFLEVIVELLSKAIYEVLGNDGKKYLAFLGTLFIYILTMNLFGLIPLMKSPSSSLNIAIALAVCVFVLVQYLNIRNMGILGFLYHLAGSPKGAIGWIMVPLMLPIELLTQITRPITLSLRLFGNIMGEEALIGYFTLLGVAAFGFFHIPLNGGLPLQVPFMFLGILTSVMQALVFTLLSAVYILLSMPHVENNEHKE